SSVRRCQPLRQQATLNRRSFPSRIFPRRNPSISFGLEHRNQPISLIAFLLTNANGWEANPLNAFLHGFQERACVGNEIAHLHRPPQGPMRPRKPTGGRDFVVLDGRPERGWPASRRPWTASGRSRHPLQRLDEPRT